ncbi:acylphosphatase [Reinekea sp.]|jgi:acylphosphatase|uniref:acylphosphatase n=1 Tax=Reinekea sp. TaxID=1970455 RepID=UPI002A809BC3|nr:acylphosphatase [Reinekea sp.]
MQQCLKAWVYGKVQGVGYRLFCKRRAKELGLQGYALNLPDGRVEVLICGDETQLQKMIESLYVGPTFAQVLGVDVEPSDPQRLTGFMTGG